MRCEPVNEADKSWHWSFECQWREWFSGKFNWRNVDLLVLSFEFGTYKGRYVEGTIALLGLVVRFEWVHRLSRSAWLAVMDQMKAEAIDALDEDDDRNQQQQGAA